jgi:hypothetical protein
MRESKSGVSMHDVSEKHGLNGCDELVLDGHVHIDDLAPDAEELMMSGVAFSDLRCHCVGWGGTFRSRIGRQNEGVIG